MTADEARQIIHAFQERHILVIGDVMLDRFIWGNVSRISPEAPVPVVEVKKESFYPGGAANVARNLTPFGSKVSLVGLTGEDENGRILNRTLSGCGIDVGHLVVLDDFITITKTRVVARHQQVVRIDREKKRALTGEQKENLLSQLRALAPELSGIIIEDYGKGLITAELVEGIVEIAREHGLVTTVDPNPNNPIPWKGVTAVKPNRKEAFHEAGVIDEFDEETEPEEDEALLAVGDALLEKWNSDHVLITLGEQGMMLFSRDEPPFHLPTRAQEVFDVSGAGDTAIAVFTLALCSGGTPRVAAELSNQASGIVVGKFGTAQVTKEELISATAAALAGHEVEEEE